MESVSDRIITAPVGEFCRLSGLGRTRVYELIGAGELDSFTIGKARTIQHMMVTSFWHPDGTPMSAQQFLEMLFGKLPEFLRMKPNFSRCGVRRIRRQAPPRLVRKRVRQRTDGRDAEGHRCREERSLRRADARSLCLPTLTREERAAKAKVEITSHFNNKQQVFLTFVLSHYVQVGVEELDREKLRPLLLLKYHNAIADAVADLGKPEEIGNIFAGFQKYLYQEAA